MKNLTCRIAIITALLFACAAPVTSFAKEQNCHKEGNGKSGIIGHIAFLPGPWHIRIDTAKFEFIKEIQADEYGNFEVDLRPGTYILTPFFPSIDGDGAELVGANQTVTVERKHFTRVVLSIVNGPE